MRTPSDEAVEAWFNRNRVAVASASDEAVEAIAAWIPIVDLPANDIGELVARRREFQSRSRRLNRQATPEPRLRQ